MIDDVKSPSSAAPDLRAGRVARTEALLTEAARDLFIQRGYVSTTLADVARLAGVAPRTVYVRFGTKAALFRRVVDEALVGDSEPVDLLHRPRTQDALTASTLRERISAMADVCVGVAERAGPLFLVGAQAEGLEPEVAEAAQAGRLATTRLSRTFWKRARADGLVGDIDLARLTMAADLLICADTVVHLRRTGTWSSRRYRSLIVETLTAVAAARA